MLYRYDFKEDPIFWLSTNCEPKSVSPKESRVFVFLNFSKKIQQISPLNSLVSVITNQRYKIRPGDRDYHRPNDDDDDDDKILGSSRV